MEKGLLLGAAAFVLGVVLILVAVNQWRLVEFGRLDYALAIGGADVARADGAELAPVAGGASAVVAIPVKLDLTSAARAAADLTRGAEVQVDLTGRALVAGIPLPLDVRGKVPARR